MLVSCVNLKLALPFDVFCPVLCNSAGSANPIVSMCMQSVLATERRHVVTVYSKGVEVLAHVAGIFRLHDSMQHYFISEPVCADPSTTLPGDELDCLFLQLFEPVFPGERHPLVPYCEYVYLTDRFLLCHPRDIYALRFIVPEITRARAPPGSRREGIDRHRHNFFCLPLLL